MLAILQVLSQTHISIHTKKVNSLSKKKLTFPTAYTVLLVLTIIVGLITHFVPSIIPAKMNDIIMSPITGMIGMKDSIAQEKILENMQNGNIIQSLNDLKGMDHAYIDVGNVGTLAGAIDVAFFILIIGGFLGVVTKTGALDAGIASIVKRMKGKELRLIPILMIIFSLGGTSYGMAEESLAFYALITATMLSIGFDPLVAVATIMLGAGCGTLGSTVNPFAPGVAIASAKSVGVNVDQEIIIIIGALLWLSTLAISIFFVMRYAKRVKGNRSLSLVTEKEWKSANEAFASHEIETLVLTRKRKLVLILFIFSFIVMVLSTIPWTDFGIGIFEFTKFLTGVPFGEWSFPQLAAWFFIMSLIIGLIYQQNEKELMHAFIVGASDMVGVAFILGISRGISFIMSNSGLDLFLLNKASGILSNISSIAFVFISYFIYLGLSFFIPSSSGLATVSIPIFAPLAQNLNLSPEVIIMIFTAGSGFINLFTPTSGVVMGGLSIAKVEYGTWMKFVWKILIPILIVSIMILCVAIIFL